MSDPGTGGVEEKKYSMSLQVDRTSSTFVSLPRVGDRDQLFTLTGSSRIPEFSVETLKRLRVRMYKRRN